MARKIVRNPQSGNYQIFSSIVDAFLLDDELTKEELTEFWQQQYGVEGMKEFNKTMVQLDKASGPQYNKNIEEWMTAKMWDVHQAEHGPKSRDVVGCLICQDIKRDEAEDAKKNGK